METDNHQPTKEKKTADHEAGHAVLMYVQRLRIEEVSTVPNPAKRTSGHTIPKKWKDTPHYHRKQEEMFWRRRYSEACITSLYGGIVAEELCFGNYDTGACSNDLSTRFEYYHLDNHPVISVHSGGDEDAFLAWMKSRAELYLGNYFSGFQALAKALEAGVTFDHEETKAIIEANIPDNLRVSDEQDDDDQDL